jgi:hypothetical protein
MAEPKLIPDDELPELDRDVILKPSDIYRLQRRDARSNKTLKQRVEEGVDAEFDRLYQQARKNVEAALKRGDKTVSMWFIDTYLYRKGKRIEVPLVSDVSTPEGLRALSEEALAQVKEGKLPLDQLKLLQDAIARHIVLTDSGLLGEMRREIEELQLALQAKNHGAEHMPAWGRLRAITAAPEVIDHDDDDEDYASDPVPQPPRDDIDPRARNLMDD